MGPTGSTNLQEGQQANTALQKRLTKVWVNDLSEGVPILQDAMLIDVGIIQRQVDRWTRGLYYHRFKEPMLPELKIEVAKLFPPEISMTSLHKLMGQHGFKPLWVHVEPRVLSYFYGVSPEDKEKGVAFYIFFDTEVYMATTKVA